jgi:beta-lactam-binding protein with PASTA domain
MATLTVVILVLGTLVLLHVVTRHGETYVVPDFASMRMPEAADVALKNHVTLILDDSVYVAHKPRGIILKQKPHAGAQVKKSRKVYVVINAQSVKMIAVPNVVDVSLRQARVMLEASGLEVGLLTFSPDLAHGIVLNQLYKGRHIAHSTKLPAGSKIDLVIGQSGLQTEVPALKGMSLSAAKSAVIEAMLNVGKVHYNGSIRNNTDSLNAIVYSQFPAAKDNAVPLGTAVDIFLTTTGGERDIDEDEE